VIPATTGIPATTRRIRATLLSLLLLVAAAPVRAQELLPLETTALDHKAAGDIGSAITVLLTLATDTAREANDEDAAARVEAWATEASRLCRIRSTAGQLQQLDALRESRLATTFPLLRDRLGMAGLIAAGPGEDAGRRAEPLGLLDRFWLVGPFDNERGVGYRSALPPELGFDATAEWKGKQRAVHWRLLPPLAGSHVLALSRIVHPHEQSLVYAAVALVAEAATTAVFELGCTGSFRVFCNGVEVGSREVERTFAYDQDAVALALAAGPNLLVWKLCHQEGVEWQAAARLRALDGSPLGRVRVSTEANDLQAAAKTAPVAAEALPTPSLGARTHWQIGKVKGADALRLAWLWRARAADGDLNRRDHAAALCATTELPRLPEAHILSAISRESQVRSAADRDDNDARRSLEQALALNPDHVEALLRLAKVLRSGSGLFRQARELADHALRIKPGHSAAVMMRAATWQDEGVSGLAEVEVLAAAALPEAAPELLRTAADIVDDREPARALELRSKVPAASGTENDVVATAVLLARTGKADAAIDLLTRTLKADPFAAKVSEQLAAMFLARAEYAQALAVCEKRLELAPDDSAVMVTASRCCRLLGERSADAGSRQQELLRQALSVEPNRRDDERYLEYLVAAEHGDPNPFYTPYRHEAQALIAADAGPPADAAAAKDPLHWILRQRVVRANGNGTTNTYQHEIVRVLTEQGARQLARYRLPWWQGEQRARLLACAVYRKDGTVQRPALQGSSVSMPELQPGDVVAVEGRIDDTAPSFFGDYFGYVHEFKAPDGSPVRSNELVVLADPGRNYRHQECNGAPAPAQTTLEDGTLMFRWQMNDLSRDVPEIRRPSRRESDPIVRITTYRDWDHFASWWWNLIKNQLEVTPAMREKVAQVCEGCTTADAKIAAIYRFVTTDVRYEAWEFGVHGYKPYSTPVIYERRHGDCKDKALLLCALLGEIGVEAHPVLIFADERRSLDDLELALVEQFNHCIAWLPAAGSRPEQFLDGTATWHPTDTLPDMDQGAKVLIVDNGRAVLRTVPVTTPEQNAEREEFQITLQPAGQAQLRVEYRPIGNEAVDLRARLATEPARRNEVVERQLVHTFGKLSLESLDCSAVLDLAAPVRLTAVAALPEIGNRTAQGWQLPSTWGEEDLQDLAGERERRTPLLLGVPRGAKRTVRYVLPPGLRAADLPRPVQRQAPFGSFTMSWRTEGDQVVIERYLAFTASRIATGDYTAFRDFAAAVHAADTQLVLLSKDSRR
jgi:tetratricopeptide (TPR) repeat protein